MLNELVNEHTNDLVRSSELLSIALLNTAGDPVVSVGAPMNLQQKDLLQEGEHWGANSVTFVTAIAGASVTPEGVTNTTVVLPSFRSMTNSFTNAPPENWREFQRRDGRLEGAGASNVFIVTTDNAGHFITNEMPRGDDTNRFIFVERGAGPPEPPPPGQGDRSRTGELRPRRPPWMRWMDEAQFESLVKKRELHGLVMTLSTENLRAISVYDFWLRCVVVLFAGIAVVGIGSAWRNISRTSDLQIRLVRASELNSHLREMNLAAAGLAHETRNPLNIIRGMAQMLSKQTDVSPEEIREKSRAIVDETDKVTAQLNEFINYSRPREVRRSKIALNSAVNEVVRTLAHDIEEKKLRVETGGDPIAIEADEQLLRQVLFNLLLNAIQAVDAERPDSNFSAARQRRRSVARNPRRRPRRAARAPPGNFQAVFHHQSKGHRPGPGRRAADRPRARLGNRMPGQRTQRRPLPHHPFENRRLIGLVFSSFN